MVVPRTCSEWPEKTDTQPSEEPLAKYGSDAAYVLLGGPGAGKTVAFQEEAKREGACYVTARDFLTFENMPEWQKGALFIDALDEARAGSADQRTPLDAIRAKLHDQLGSPRFRLSCREADWLASDRTHLAAASKDGQVRVLRLNPLSRSQARELLAQRRDVDSADAFIEHAEALGMSSLLCNPQDLEMLASAVSSGKWPQTRQKTFELACRLIGNATNASDADLLAAAGRLCAVLLLGGHQGVDLCANAKPDHVALREITGPSQEALKAVLRTKLFVYASTQIATPAHRHIAEYLAGRYLAGLIRDGLPIGRIIALLTGADGGIVTGLRGLCAWLAAHSQTGRLALLERDPIGAVLYGDVRAFAAHEKQRLLQALEQYAAKDPWNLLSRQDLDPRWGDLATPDVEPIFRQALTDASGDAKQVVAQAVLAALERGNSIPALRPLLMDVVRKNDCWPVVRSAALRAYLKEHGDDGSASELTRLLDDINAGTVRDRLDGLRGALLIHLYPRWLTPAETCGYLRPPDVPSVRGLCEHFWDTVVVDESTPEQLGEMLDTLAGNPDVVPREGPLRMVPHRLLARLVAADVEVDARRLLDWLGLVSGTHDGWLDSSLSSWLAARPQRYRRYKELADAAVADQSDMDAMKRAASLKLRRLLLRRRAHSAQAVAEDEADAHRAGARQDEGQDEERRREQERWRRRLRRHEAEVRANECPPALLNDLARAYFGLFEQAETPAARLSALLGDEDLVRLALAAICSTPSRTDLPEPADVNRLASEGSYHYLAWPFLAALEERWPLELGRAPLDDDGMRLATAFHLNTPPPMRPCWYQSMLRLRPDLVADMLIDSCKITFPRGETQLAAAVDFGDELGRAVAKHAVVPLLRLFPSRCRRDQLSTLRHLLAAALDSGSHNDLAQLVRRKLSLRSMTVAQQLHWLCFGLMLVPETYVPQARKRLCDSGGNPQLDIIVMLFEGGALRDHALDIDALSLLVQALGPHCSASWPVGAGGTVSTSMLCTETVRRLVASLASRSSPAATEALKQLAHHEELRRWAGHLQHAAKLQADARREAEFRHASVDAVLATLDGLRPANAADLAALTVDCLQQLADRIRHGSTSDWRQYWNTPTRSPWEPKGENLCRDALLSDLRTRLEQADVQAVSEGVYANDKRADVLVSRGDFNVPVEVKKSSSKDLWQAIQGQLVKKYTIDPGAQGHGIYLVFWFGLEHCQRHPSAGRPRTAADLAERLQATLPPEQALKVKVVVIDVSRPD